MLGSGRFQYCSVIDIYNVGQYEADIYQYSHNGINSFIADQTSTHIIELYSDFFQFTLKIFCREDLIFTARPMTSR